MSLERYRRIIREEMQRRAAREVGGKTLVLAVRNREGNLHLSTFWDALAEEESEGHVIVTRANGERRVTVRWVSANDAPVLQAGAPDRTLEDAIDTMESDAYALTAPASLQEVRMARSMTQPTAVIEAEPLDPYDALGAQIATLLRQSISPLIDQRARERTAQLQAEVNESRRRIRVLETDVQRERQSREEAEELARMALSDLEAERQSTAALRAQLTAVKPLIDAFKAIGTLSEAQP